MSYLETTLEDISQSVLTHNSSIPLRWDQLFSWTLKSFLPQLFMRPCCGGGFTDSWTRFPSTKLITSEVSQGSQPEVLLVVLKPITPCAIISAHEELFVFLSSAAVSRYCSISSSCVKTKQTKSCLLQLWLFFVSFSEHPQLVQLIKLI